MNLLRFTIIKGITNTILTSSPIGWDDTFVNINRSKDWFGLQQEYTQSLKFVKDGATLLRDYYYNYLPHVTDTDIYLKIEKLDTVALTYGNDIYFKFDMATMKDRFTEVEITLVSFNLYYFLKKNLKTVYSFPDIDPGGVIPSYLQNYVYFDAGHAPISLFISDVLTLIFDKVTEGGYTTGTFDISIDLDTVTINSNLFVTTGLCIRDQANYPILSISLDDVLKALNAIWDIGIGVEVIAGKETLMIKDDKEYFLDSTTIIESVGKVNELVISSYEELLFNKIEIGYQKADSNNIIVNEPNYSSEFKLNVANDKKLDFVSKIRADGTGVYYLINTPADTKWDNDLFFLMGYNNVPPATGWFPAHSDLRKKYYPGVTYDLINAFLTPARCVLRKQKYWDSLRLNQSVAIEFTASNCDNLNNETNFSSWQQEYADIAAGTDGYFFPILFEFDAPISKDFYKNFIANKTGCVEFEFENNTYTGFIMDVKINPNEKITAHFKLMSTADNDLTKLIR